MAGKPKQPREDLGYRIPATIVKFQNWSDIYGHCER
jgi:hypothetical protein